MKAILTTLVLTCLVITTHVRAGNDSIVAKAPEKASFYASASSLNGDSIRFLILNPDADDVVVRVYSDRDLKVMEYDLDGKKAVKLTYVMDDMRKCCYTAVVVHNDKEVLRKKIEIR